MTSRSTGRVIVAAAALAFVWPVSSSHAGTYEVLSCAQPDGRSGGSGGWTATSSGPGYSYELNCASRPLAVRTDGLVVHGRGQWGGLRFSVPNGLSITGIASRFRQNATASPAPGWLWYVESRGTAISQPEPFGYSVCSGAGGWCQDRVFDSLFRETRPLSSADWILRCDPRGAVDCPAGSTASVEVEAARFRIEDLNPPTITSVRSAALQSADPISGTREVSFEATDVGSGVWKAMLDVDGKTVAQQVVDPNGGQCIPPFRLPVPCKAKVAGTVPLDTSTLVDGSHHAHLKVLDATGTNQATFGPISFRTSNRSVESLCESAPGSVTIGGPAAPVRFGSRIPMRVFAPNAPGAEAVVLEGTRSLSMSAAAKLDESGRLTMSLPPGGSRLVRIGVRPVGSSQKFVCSAPHRFRVAAGVTLSVGPKAVRNGRSIHVRGRVLGGSEAARKGVVVQARARGVKRWATVRVLRANGAGRYSSHYVFRNTFRPVTYEFRTQVLGERGFPYSSGHSGLRPVRVFP